MNAPKNLRDYQQSGRDFMLNYERVILADDPGVGKTVQALAALDELIKRPHYVKSPAKQIFIVCPASAKRQWVEELLNYPDLAALLQQDHSPIHICTWDHISTVANRTKVDHNYCVIFDEAHKVKHYTTARHKAARKLVSHARYRWMLTGTPIDRRPSELLNLLNLIARLTPFGGFWPFALRYCAAVQGPGGWDFSGADHLEELGTKLREHNILLRRTTDVLNLPPLHIEPLFYPLAQAQHASYREILVAEPLAPGLLDEGDPDDTMAAGQLARARSLLGDMKADLIPSLARVQRQRTGSPVIIFTQHKSVAQTIARALGCAFITGDVPQGKRKNLLETFCGGNKDYLVLSLSLAAEAIDGLQNVARTMIIAELPWTASAFRQAVGRIWRFGQTRDVHVLVPLANDTVDQIVFDLITRKTQTSYTLFDPEDSDQSQLEVFKAIRERLAA